MQAALTKRMMGITGFALLKPPSLQGYGRYYRVALYKPLLLQDYGGCFRVVLSKPPSLQGSGGYYRVVLLRAALYARTI